MSMTGGSMRKIAILMSLLVFGAFGQSQEMGVDQGSAETGGKSILSQAIIESIGPSTGSRIVMDRHEILIRSEQGLSLDREEWLATMDRMNFEPVERLGREGFITLSSDDIRREEFWLSRERILSIQGKGPSVGTVIDGLTGDR
jgi:hypothetical protein